jgi:hypothetical protein
MKATFAKPARSVSSITSASNERRWAGIAMSALAVAFLTFDGAMKLAKIGPVLEGMARVGYPEATARPIGFVLLACVALYIVPRTAIIGAVVLTGYLGGAIATHVRLEDPLFTHVLAPIYVAVLAWGGLYLRDPRVRALLSRVVIRVDEAR